MGPMLAIVSLFLLILFPISLVLFNGRFSRKQKAVGVLVSIFFSWMGFILFYILTVIAPQQPTLPNRKPS